MIGFLRGILIQKHPPALLVDVGGVGYELEAPMSTFYSLPGVGEEVRLHTHLVVREDAHLLYGFASESERRLFRDLLRVSGVGPKIGLALLSGMTVDAFLLCVEAEDVESLVRVPGIGRKTAERLVIEMRDRIRTLGEMPATGAALPGGAAVARVSGGAQEVTTRALASSYQPFVVQAGLPVRWTIEVKAEDLNGCNNALVVPAYGMRKRLAPGKNVVEFTPDRAGTIAYTCWMGMIRSTILVVPDLAQAAAADLPPADGTPAGRAAIAAGLAVPGAGVPAGAACSCCATP